MSLKQEHKPKSKNTNPKIIYIKNLKKKKNPNPLWRSIYLNTLTCLFARHTQRPLEPPLPKADTAPPHPTSTPSLIPIPFSFLIFSATSTILSNTFDLLRIPDPILEFNLLHLPDLILKFDSLYSLWFWLNLACGLRALRLWMLSLLLSGLICGLVESVVVELVGLIGCCWVGWFRLINMGNWLLLVGIFILIVVVSWTGFSMEVELILVFGYLLGLSVQIWKREV